jgi:hypothetical protein
LVPYLGIVFCPGAVVAGTIGIVSGDSSRGICYASTIVGFVVLAIQLFLWWVLYQVPLWANRF